MKVPEIHELYNEHVPRVMEKRWRSGKSKALGKVADPIFGNRKFEAALTGIGIVATNWRLEKPMIFKNQLSRAHGSTGSFVPGFGCTFSEVVQASCSAYPAGCESKRHPQTNRLAHLPPYLWDTPQGERGRRQDSPRNFYGMPTAGLPLRSTRRRPPPTSGPHKARL